MEMNMLRKALWVILKPLLQLVTNLINPEIGEEWLKELNRFLRKETSWQKKWVEVDGIISSTLSSPCDMDGSQMINGLEKKGWKFDDYSKSVLINRKLKAGKKYNVRIITSSYLGVQDSVTRVIYKKAVGHEFTPSSIELAYLICQNFTDSEFKQMDLRTIKVMSEPFKQRNEKFPVLCIGHEGPYGICKMFEMDTNDPICHHGHCFGFAFEKSE